MRFLLIFVAMAVCSAGMASAGIPIDISESTLSVDSADTFTATNVSLPGMSEKYWGTFRWNEETLVWEIIDAGEIGIPVGPRWTFDIMSVPSAGTIDQNITIVADCGSNAYHITVLALTRTVKLVPSVFNFTQGVQSYADPSSTPIEILPGSSGTVVVFLPAGMDVCTQMMLRLYGNVYTLRM